MSENVPRYIVNIKDKMDKIEKRDVGEFGVDLISFSLPILLGLSYWKKDVKIWKRIKKYSTQFPLVKIHSWPTVWSHPLWESIKNWRLIPFQNSLISGKKNFLSFIYSIIITMTLTIITKWSQYCVNISLKCTLSSNCNFRADKF